MSAGGNLETDNVIQTDPRSLRSLCPGTEISEKRQVDTRNANLIAKESPIPLADARPDPPRGPRLASLSAHF